jgi:hypothetical protein
MRTKRYYRVRFGVRVIFWMSLLVAIFWGVNHLNWMGDHYCFKTMVECYFPEGK